jgi:cysteine synthase A
MSSYGAEFVLTPREKGMKGAIERSKELISETKDSWMPMQFDNPANTEIHRIATAQEILKDFPDGLDYLISGVGTGGHLTGCAEVLKKAFPKLKVYAVEPELSPVLSGGSPSPHPLQGIGAGFIPSILNTKILDGIIKVSKEEAFTFTRRAAKEEGLFVGISSGASLAAVNQKLKEFPKGSRILTFSYDTGERYLSIEGLF